MKPIGTVRLVDKKTRVVKVFGPPVPGGKRPRLWLGLDGLSRPYELKAFCFKKDGRESSFIVDSGAAEDAFLALLARYPHAPARPGEPYGGGWLVRE